MARGVSIDPPALGTRVQNIRQRASTRFCHGEAGFVEIVDKKVEVHVLFAVLTRPRRWSVVSHTVEGKTADRLLAQRQPVGIALRRRQVEDLLPEARQLLGVINIPKLAESACPPSSLQRTRQRSSRNGDAS